MFKNISFLILLIRNKYWRHLKKKMEAIYQSFKFLVSWCRYLNLGWDQNTDILYRLGVLIAGYSQNGHLVLLYIKCLKTLHWHRFKTDCIFEKKKTIKLSSLILVIFYVNYIKGKGNGYIFVLLFYLPRNFNERNEFIHIFRKEKERSCLSKLRYCWNIWWEFREVDYNSWWS